MIIFGRSLWDGRYIQCFLLLSPSQEKVSCEYTSTHVHGLIPAQMMIYNCHWFVIELIYSYISIYSFQKYPDLSIPEREFLHICSKKDLYEKYNRASIEVDIDYLL